MKHTAVEWLMQKWYSDEFIGEEDFNQAKAMEKEQIIKANRDGVDMVIEKRPYITGEQYYNETFNP